MKKVILEEIENMKYLLGYKKGVVVSEQQVGNQKFNFNANPAAQGGGINYTPTAPADMFKNAQATAAGTTTQATGTPAAQQKFNFNPNPNPNPNVNPESGINFKPQTPQELAKGVASASPAPAASTTPVTPIKIGVEYPSIKVLQNLLNTKNQAGLKEDSKYGPKTAASVLAALQKLPVNSTETKTKDTSLADPSKAATVTAAVSTGTAAGTNTSTGTAAGTTPAAGTTAGSGVVSVNANDIIG